MRDAAGTPVPGVTVRFKVTGSDGTVIEGERTTDANGRATFCYQGPDFPREDVIDAFADTNDNDQRDLGEPAGLATKSFVLPPSTPLCEVIITQGGRITAANGDRATFGGNAHLDDDGLVKGEQQYTDHGPAQPMHVHSTEILVVTCSADRKEATIYGRATVDSVPGFFFRIRVRDNDESGAGSDLYGILLSNGYASGDQVLKGGNVQIRDKA